MSNQTIWKYQLKITDLQTIEVPIGATFLTVQNQGGQLCLWALVIPGKTKLIDIEVLGTGNPISYAKRLYIGTAQINPFVWHVFERIN